MDNLWTIKREKNKHIKAGFPTELIKKIIDNFVPDDNLVIDPFMGSGTTAKMAMLNGRNYIGFEISKEYCDIAEQRLLEAERSNHERSV